MDRSLSNSTLLQKGIAAARAGRSREAQQLLHKVVTTDPQNEMAWLWLSGLVATNQQKQICLEHVLRANPKNVYAQAGLKRLQGASPVDKDIIEERLACVTNGLVPKLPTTPTPGQTKPNPTSTAKVTDQLHPFIHKLPSQTPTPTPDPLLTTCPVCDLPVQMEEIRCPHCFVSYDFMRGVPPRSLAPTQPLKPRRRNILRFLGTVLFS